VPFLYQRHALWRRGFLAAWLMSTAGVIGACWAALAGVDHAEAILLLTLAGVVFGVGNGLLTTVGFRQQGGVLVMTRVHPAAAAAIGATAPVRGRI
jgi:hypothetical protein